ncbi:VMA21-like domain containing protein [Cryptosporidium felis]|nr:VMA21-like domain containing protein [Cryptosporidium felis]
MTEKMARSKTSCVGPAPTGISRVLKETSNRKVLLEFILFTLSLILFPCGMFFLSPIFLKNFLPEDSISIVSAIFSVFLVNLICGVYVYRAFLQEKGEWQNMGPPSTPASRDSESRKSR